MALPGNLSSVTVIGTFITPEGSPSTGSVSFTPSSWLTDSGANLSIPNSAVSKTLGTAGDFSAVLPVTDDPDVTPANWVYSVSEVVDGVSRSYNILLPGTATPGGTVYLADIAPAAAAGPEYYSLASSLSIGTVTTVATGGSATATITGTAPSQILNLGIPVGATGNVASSGSGSVGTAAVSPTGDPDTGIYYPAANQVAITTGGTQALLLSGGAVSNPTFTGQVIVPAGSAGTPAISPTGDTNTGLFSSAADTLNISTAGTEAMRVASNQRVGVGATSPSTLLHVRGAHVAGAGLIMVNANSGQRYTGISLHNDSTLAGYLIHDNNTSKLQVQCDTGQTISLVVAGTERFNVDANGLITGSGSSLGAWTSYTPTLGGTGWALGDGTATGAWCQIGKVIFFRAQIVFGSTSTYGAVVPTITGPANVRASISGNHDIQVNLLDTSLGSEYVAWTRTASSLPLTLNISYLGTNSLRTDVTSTAPFTWANGDRIQVTGFVEAA